MVAGDLSIAEYKLVSNVNKLLMYLGDREQLEGSQEGLLMLIKLKKVRINNNEYIRVFETG